MASAVRRPADGPNLAALFPEAAELGEALRAAGLSIAVAESCTGGLLGAALTAVAGSSAYVAGGVIAYSDASKADLLGVDRGLLQSVGAVSRPVAEAMAEGARRALHADIGVGITGIAGPSAEGSGKPVGMIFVSVAGPGSALRTERQAGDRGRDANRAGAVRAALVLCREAIRTTPHAS